MKHQNGMEVHAKIQEELKPKDGLPDPFLPVAVIEQCGPRLYRLNIEGKRNHYADTYSLIKICANELLKRHEISQYRG